ncbi:uncharacterized protein LOC114299317 [Camellia sinensis]|uniref:uncharacterized protein LOC114299317 n=1 Tax=Camellia sinensis TaxID=4442 RepID=UPI0010364FB0|nr:uncharacterized protein LOC114299317 [Camellia sinensis]
MARRRDKLVAATDTSLPPFRTFLRLDCLIISVSLRSLDLMFIRLKKQINEPPSYKEALLYHFWHKAMLEEFSALQKQHTWSLVSLPPAKNAIGCKWVFKVKRNSDGIIASSGYLLSQSKYANDILLKAGLSSCKPCSSPIFVKPSTPPNASLPFSNPALYRSIVGALQYLIITRPNLSVFVNQAYQFMHAPTIGNFVAVKRILKFVQGTLTHGLSFSPSTFDVNGYSYSNWVGDVHDRKSTFGYCVFFGSNLVS